MKPISILALVLPTALAKTISVTVGKGGFVYSPDTITADVGDTVEFTFFPISHSVTQSSFAAPCNPLAGGFSSGFVPVSTGQSSSQVFKISVTDTNPIWFYCSQVQHCQLGMAGVINPPTSGNTLAAYKAAAQSASTGAIPAGVLGGTFGPPGGNEESSSSSSSSSSAAASSSSSSSAAAETTTTEETTTTAAAATTTVVVSTTKSTTVVATTPTANATTTSNVTVTGAPIAATGAASVGKMVAGWGVLAVGIVAGLAL